MPAGEARVGQGLGVSVEDDPGSLLELGSPELGCDLERLRLGRLARLHGVDGLSIAATLGRFDLGTLASTLR